MVIHALMGTSAMLKPVMDAREASAMYQIEDTAKLAAYIRATATRFAAVDGFCGAGKSTLAKDLAALLSWPLVAFDDFLHDDSMNVQSSAAWTGICCYKRFKGMQTRFWKVRSCERWCGGRSPVQR